jgi:hypothetical protein
MQEKKNVIPSSLNILSSISIHIFFKFIIKLLDLYVDPTDLMIKNTKRQRNTRKRREPKD